MLAHLDDEYDGDEAGEAFLREPGDVTDKEAAVLGNNQGFKEEAEYK